MRNIFFTLVLIPALLIAGCVEEGSPAAPGGSDNSAVQPPQQQATATPETAAASYASKTYFSTETTTYSGFSFSTRTLNDNTTEVTIRFTQTVKAPAYTLNRIMEQTVTAEKSGSDWMVTDTPPARIVSQSYS